MNRDGSETLLSPGSHNKQRTDLINYTRKAATEFVAKYHLGMKNSNQANKTLSTSQFASYNNSASPSPAPPSPAVDLGGGGVLLSMGAGYDIPSSQERLLKYHILIASLLYLYHFYIETYTLPKLHHFFL